MSVEKYFYFSRPTPVFSFAQVVGETRALVTTNIGFQLISYIQRFAHAFLCYDQNSSFQEEEKSVGEENISSCFFHNFF